MNPERLYTRKLREAVHLKIRNDWNKEKQVTFASEYNGLDSITNKDGFYNEIKDEIDEALAQKYGLEKASRRSVSKDSIRRFLDLNYDKSFTDKNKDAFSVFLGYEHFKDFCLQNSAVKETNGFMGGLKLFGSKWILALSFLMVLALAFIYWSYGNQSDDIGTGFIIKGGTENFFGEEIELKYDLKNLDYNRAYFDINGQTEIIQQRTGTQIIKLRSPGRKYIRLMADGKAIMTKSFFVKTKEWWGTVNANKPIRDIPFIAEGVMRLPQEVVPPNKLETYGSFQLFENFGIDTDAMVFETRVKNSAKMGGTWAFDISLNLFGRDGKQFSFNVLAPDAIIYANMIVADTRFETPQERSLLGKMGLDLSYWRDVKAVLKNQNLKIFVDEELAFETPYEGQIGDLCGIQYYIKGRGAVDYMKISDLHGKVVYQDDFERD